MSTVTYSTKLREALDDLRPQFQEINAGLEGLTRRRVEIAPHFIAAFRLWRRETRRPFIAFVHAIDPSVPVNDRRAYRQHRAYRAAQYLKQLAEQPDQPVRHGVTPLTFLAVAIKSFLPLCHPHEQAALAILVKASRWRDREISRLLARVKRSKAIPLPKAPRLAAKVSREAVIAFAREHAA